MDRPQGGLGNGLTMAWRLVKLHGGMIELVSATESMGSDFTIGLLASTVADASEREATIWV